MVEQLNFCQRARAKQEKKQSLLSFEVPDELLHNKKEALSLPAKLLNSRELEITNANVSELLKHLHTLDPNLRWKAEEVISAFIKRACIADQATNCLTEILFEKGLQRAREVDAYLEKNGKPSGSLAGLPISLKDCFNIKGYDSTLGFVAWIDQPATYESLLVTILQDAGAILYCKTNVPTAI